MRGRLIAFSSDPGGAACLLPVLHRLYGVSDLALFAGSDALGVFQSAGFEPGALDSSSVEDILTFGFSGVLTSASSLPERDMTEKLLWRRAAQLGAPSLAVLDQWQCYVERFSGPGGEDRLGYVPTRIAVMDDHAREAMIREGFPEARLVVTGHPALESVRARVAQLKSEGRRARRQVTWFSQPLRALFGRDLGFDERDMLGVVREAMTMMGEERPYLVCKLHPRERREDFPSDDADFSVVVDGREGADLLAASDVVMGMSTVMLVHAVVAGVPTVSVSPISADTRNRCHPVEVGVIPRLSTASDVAAHLGKLLRDPEARRMAMVRQSAFPDHVGATEAVLAVLRDLVA